MDLSVYHCGYEKNRLVRMEEAEGGRHYLFYYIVSGEGLCPCGMKRKVRNSTACRPAGDF